MKITQRLVLFIFLLTAFQASYAMGHHHAVKAEQDMAPTHHTASMHDCCDESGTTQAKHDCESCGADCQCGSGCHFSTASMTLMNGDLLLQRLDNSNPFSLFISSLQSADLAHEKRPPRLG